MFHDGFHIVNLLNGLSGKAAFRSVLGLNNIHPSRVSYSDRRRSRVMTAPARAATLLLFLAIIAAGGGLLALNFTGQPRA